MLKTICLLLFFALHGVIAVCPQPQPFSCDPNDNTNVIINDVVSKCDAGLVCNTIYDGDLCETCIAADTSGTCPTPQTFTCDGTMVNINGIPMTCPDNFVCNNIYANGICDMCIASTTEITCPDPKPFECDPSNPSLVIIDGTPLTCPVGSVCNVAYTGGACDGCIAADTSDACPTPQPFTCDGTLVNINGMPMTCPDNFVCNNIYANGICDMCVASTTETTCPDPKPFTCDPSNPSLIIIDGISLSCPAGSVCNVAYTGGACDSCIVAPDVSTCPEPKTFTCTSDPSMVDISGTLLQCPSGQVCNTVYTDGQCAACITPSTACPAPKPFSCSATDKAVVIVSGLSLTCTDGLVCNTIYANGICDYCIPAPDCPQPPSFTCDPNDPITVIVDGMSLQCTSGTICNTIYANGVCDMCIAGTIDPPVTVPPLIPDCNDGNGNTVPCRYLDSINYYRCKQVWWWYEYDRLPCSNVTMDTQCRTCSNVICGESVAPGVGQAICQGK